MAPPNVPDGDGLPLTNQHIDELAEAVRARFIGFLCEFKQQDGDVKSSYQDQANVMRESETSSLFVDFTHLSSFDSDLAEAVRAQFYRFEPYLRKAVFEFIRMDDASYTINDDASKSEKEFFVCFYNIPYISKIRDLRTMNIGHLVSFCGTVTRTSEVCPELLYGVFVCSHCGMSSTAVEQQFKYQEPQRCQNRFCPNTSDWQLNTEKSVFVDWQRVRVQENSDEIPAGSMPRTVDVILRHENVEQAKAGDRVVFTGTLIVLPDVSKFVKVGEATVSSKSDRTHGNSSSMNADAQGVRGLKALGVRELTYKIGFLACSVQTLEQRFHKISIRGDVDDRLADFTEEELEDIMMMNRDPNLYHKIARSLCPTVYGHEEVKKGVLLMLFGGVHKVTSEGIKLRGDINVCIVGDPSTAKSQFLKYICSFLPRAIYTSGKVSTAAGLTASVVRDSETGEFCVEAGALMLADNGICCIDEFDKMDPMDQVAIHEAMEQQTISITKAGIQATLNARTSILAAANPYHGRYDRSKTLKYNVNISAPIMSRFDLFFVILDECDEESDLHIAEHIVNVHKLKEAAIQAEFTQEQIQRYIKYARTLNPRISEESKQVMVESYRKLRENDVCSNGQNNMAYRITVRQLESMIRLSEANARLDLSNTVEPKHVKEAYRLLTKSIIHVDTDSIELGNEETFGQEAKSGSTPSSSSLDETAQTTDSGDGNQLSISFEKYTAIEKALATFVRQNEDEECSGISQGELATWYLSQQDHISTEEDLIKEKRFIHSVIERLVKDGSLQEIKDLANQVDDDQEDKESSRDERLLVVHPNYVTE